jgi:hypothetical protein
MKAERPQISSGGMRRKVFYAGPQHVADRRTKRARSERDFVRYLHRSGMQ